MRRWALRTRVRDLFGLPPLPPPGASTAVPPVPRVRAELARAVPGALLRLAPGVVVLIAAGLAHITGFGWVLMVAAAVGVVGWPRTPVAAIATGILGLWVIGAPDMLLVDPASGAVPGVWRVSALMLAVYLLLVGTALAAHVSWRSVVEVGVLWRVARTMVGTQAIAQSLLLLVAWLRAWQPGGQEWLRLFAVLGAVGVAALLVPREWLVRRSRSSSK